MGKKVLWEVAAGVAGRRLGQLCLCASKAWCHETVQSLAKVRFRLQDNCCGFLGFAPPSKYVEALLRARFWRERMASRKQSQVPS